MGRQTYREMNVAQKKYVIDRVSLCPLLVAYIDFLSH